jgi:hypothetical protein
VKGPGEPRRRRRGAVCARAVAGTSRHAAHRYSLELERYSALVVLVEAGGRALLDER